jgi:hypothetical protein
VPRRQFGVGSSGLIGFTLYLNIPNWAAGLLLLFGWFSVAYPGSTEMAGLAQSAMLEQAANADPVQGELNQGAGAYKLFNNVRSFQLLSKATFVGTGIPAIVRHFWP